MDTCATQMMALARRNRRLLGEVVGQRRFDFHRPRTTGGSAVSAFAAPCPSSYLPFDVASYRTAEHQITKPVSFACIKTLDNHDQSSAK
ncbi:Protein of unknown function [Gryllus bimaculatus]|nr:Protein of unknown function [Gryllus bimaculatus]